MRSDRFDCFDAIVDAACETWQELLAKLHVAAAEYPFWLDEQQQAKAIIYGEDALTGLGRGCCALTGWRTAAS